MPIGIHLAYRQRGFFGIEGAAVYVIIGLAIALALTVAGSGAAIWYLDGKVDKANKAAMALEGARAKEEQSRKGFQSAAGSCSASVGALEARATKAETAAAKKQGENEALGRSVQAHIQAMLARPRPPGLNECDAMKKELDDEIDYRAARR